jgi:hypothetical protein
VDPDPEAGILTKINKCTYSFSSLDPGSGWVKRSGYGSGMNNPDHISDSVETIFWVKIL